MQNALLEKISPIKKDNQYRKFFSPRPASFLENIFPQRTFPVQNREISVTKATAQYKLENTDNFLIPALMGSKNLT
jgi:hypothetical protein